MVWLPEPTVVLLVHRNDLPGVHVRRLGVQELDGWTDLVDFVLQSGYSFRLVIRKRLCQRNLRHRARIAPGC